MHTALDITILNIFLTYKHICHKIVIQRNIPGPGQFKIPGRYLDIEIPGRYLDIEISGRYLDT